MVPNISSCFFARKYILGWDKNTNGKTAITWYWSEGELGNIVVQPRLPKFGNGNNPGKFLKKKNPVLNCFILRSEPFNQKFREKYRMDLKFVAKKFPIIWLCLPRLSLGLFYGNNSCRKCGYMCYWKFPEIQNSGDFLVDEKFRC